MAFTFPSSSPANNATFDHAGVRYIFRTDRDRWDAAGFPGIDDPFADFTSTAYTSDNVTSTTHIGMHDEAPFNFASGGGAGIATNSVATNGVIALWNMKGQGTAILFPTNLVASTGSSIMGRNVTAFDSSTQCYVQLDDGTQRRAGFSSTAQVSGGSFGLGGPPVSGSKLMSGAIGINIDGTGSNLISTSQTIARIYMKIPTATDSPGATGTAGQTAVILIDKDTIVKTLTSTNSNANNAGNSRFYNYRWGVIPDVFDDNLPADVT